MDSPLRQPATGTPESAVEAETLRVIAERITARAGDFGVNHARVRSVVLHPYRSSSTYPLYIAKLACDGGETRRLIVKFAPIFRQHREGRAEFVNLRTMAESLRSTPTLHVPYAFDYWEDVNALITEFRPGEQFSTHILAQSSWFSSAHSRSALARTAAQCGEWLRIYHATTARGDGTPIDDRFMRSIRRNLGRIPSQGPIRDLRGPLERAIERVVNKMNLRRVPLSVRHGDYSPSNVHLDGDGICVFDLSHHALGCIYDDISYFLVTLDTVNPYPRYWWFNPRVGPVLADAFLDGYFGAERVAREREDAVEMAAYMLKSLLVRCMQQRRVAAASGTLALAAFDRLWVGARYRDLFAGAIERTTRL